MADGPGLSIDVLPPSEGVRTRVVVTGDVDIASAPRVGDALREQLATGPVRLDLSGVTFMDSSGVRMLERTLRACAQHGHDLVIDAALSRPVTQVLELTGMLALLPLVGEGETT